MRDIQYGIESRLHAVDVALLICLYFFFIARGIGRLLCDNFGERG